MSKVLLSVVAIALIAAVVATIIAATKKQENSPRPTLSQPASQVTYSPSSVVEAEVKPKDTEIIEEASAESTAATVSKVVTKDSETPESAFPSMLAEVGDADAELASAFTYENLQDSMLTSGREAREAVKSRAPWSRFGSRANPEIWEEQMAEMKREIKASGQTLEQFMENSWAPIPEQMAAFWKDSDEGSQIPEVRSERLVSGLSRAALSEAPALTRDATQDIGKDPSASSRMTEILDARKRAKVLNLRMPALTKQQKEDIKFWSTSSDQKMSEIAKSLFVI
jgi:hypothetical protein